MDPRATTGQFLATNYIWDVSSLGDKTVDINVLRELLVRLYQNINKMNLAINNKDIGIYSTTEIVNGQKYFTSLSDNNNISQSTNPRSVLRKTINYNTALPNTGTATIPHNINCSPATTFTRIYATASDQSGNHYIPIPYASPTLANNIELKVDGTNVTIVTGSNRSNFTQTYIVLEYLQI